MLATLIPPGLRPDTLLAVDDAGAELNYGALLGLHEDWVRQVPGRRLVALLCDNTVASLGAYVGLHAAGHVVILLSEKIARAALDDLIARFGVEAVVRQGHVTLLAEPGQGMHPDLAVCLSTSGSTGSPKLVRFSSTQLAANARSIADYLELDGTERPLAHLPFEYSFGLSVLHSHMAVGAALMLTQHSIMQKPFWARLAEATSLAGVPFHMEMLLRMRLERANIPLFRTLTQAGGRLPATLAEKLHTIVADKGWQFHIMYGQTEAGPRISWLPHAEMAGNFDSIGRPIPGVSMTLADGGELEVHSPAIMMGYAEGRADLAAGDQCRGVLRTGDLAEQTEHGHFRITGRKSRFIKLQGNRVSLSEVEARLSGAGHAVACAGRDDALVLFVTNPDTEVVRQAAVALFSFPPRSMDVRHLDSLPRLPNDKIDYATLQAMVDAP